MSTPKNWPSPLPYLHSPLHAKSLSPAHILTLRTKPPSATPPPTIPSSLTRSPCPLVKITPITDPAHPAHNQHGLFAAQNLRPGAFILPYLGLVHAGHASAEDSDYDLWLDRGADVAVDAARQGNEARFVNDYRGVKDRPNAEFAVAWCERYGELCVGFWVLKGRGKGIRKGEEILVSYGKGFWGERRAELDAANNDEETQEQQEFQASQS